jgi:secretion/DNA translocation related CpaE-like protein
VSPPGHRTLLVTADPVLVDDVLRLAAAAGADVDVETDAARVCAAWPDAPLVIVGRDAADEVARLGLSRRDDVAVVAHDPDDATVWQLAVALGASQVVTLPDAQRWLIEALGVAADGARGSGLVVAVAGGRGGAGASVLAAGLAVAAAQRGHVTALVDADPIGGGLDLLLGGEGAAGVRWPDLATARGRVSAGSLRAALPSFGRLAVLSWDRGVPVSVPAAAMTAVASAAARGADLVVVDVPRHLDDAARAAVGLADVTLLVVPAEVRAAAAASRVAASLLSACRDVRVVVRTPGPARLDPAAVTGALDLPLAGVIGTDSTLAASIERGEPPEAGRGSVGRFAERFVAELLAAPRAAA